MKEEISIGGYYEGGERYHAEAVGEIEGRVPWASTHIHCITHLVMRMRITITVLMVMMMILNIQYRFYKHMMTTRMMCSFVISSFDWNMIVILERIETDQIQINICNLKSQRKTLLYNTKNIHTLSANVNRK